MTTFSCTVLPSERTFTISSDQSILTAAISQGIPLPYGCKDGACGSCKCKKISGEITHLDHSANALNEAERHDGWILTCRAIPATDIALDCKQVGSVDAWPVKKMPARVSRLERLTSDVMRVFLQLPANDQFNWHAGQYIDVLLRDGSRRSYSMANLPQTTNNGIELHIRHMPGGLFTDQVFGTMKERDILRLEGPFGSFYLRTDSDSPIILLASGTGMAPIKAILEKMLAEQIQRPTHIYWGARRPHDLYLHDWLQSISESHAHIRYTPVVSEAQEQDIWDGRTGLVHQAVQHDYPDLSHHQVYACGAPVMVDAARRDFCELAQLSSSAFYADSFTSAADKAN